MVENNVKVERHFNGKPGLVTLTVHGIVSLEVMKEAFEGMLGDPQFRKGADIIWDLSGANASAATSTEIQQLANFMTTRRKERGKDYKVAVVAKSDLTFGIAKIYGAVASSQPIEFKVFRSIDEAHQWIESSPDGSETF